jgi:hypothetical protein
MKKNEVEWQKFAGPGDIFKWLQNFSTDDEIYLSLILANNIMYFTDKRMEYLWEIILLNRVKQYLLEILFEKDWPKDIDKWFEDYLKEKCIFIGYGSASKSGQSMVYPFKQAHGIKGLTYWEETQFLHCTDDLGSKRFVFLIDDFIGSGNQAKAEWNEKIGGKSFNDVHKQYPNLKFIYLALVGYL